MARGAARVGVQSLGPARAQESARVPGGRGAQGQALLLLGLTINGDTEACCPSPVTHTESPRPGQGEDARLECASA